MGAAVTREPYRLSLCFFFFQAEDGIRDLTVTGVQTCALPISTPIVTLAAALFGATCAFPTDKSDKVLVTLEAPAHVVLRGQEMSVYARAWQVEIGRASCRERV